MRGKLTHQLSEVDTANAPRAADFERGDAAVENRALDSPLAAAELARHVGGGQWRAVCVGGVHRDTAPFMGMPVTE